MCKLLVLIGACMVLATAAVAKPKPPCPVVYEPSSMIALGAGFVGLVGYIIRKRRS
jgi:hypothetical protein